MKKEDVLKQYTTPIAAPAFVQGPHRFRRREYLNITYRTDHDALSKMVPEPLEVDQPLVRFEVLTLVTVGVLRAAGFELEATGRNPRHFDVVSDDLHEGIERLSTCEHRSIVNAHCED